MMLAITFGSVILGLSIGCGSEFSHQVAYGFPFHTVTISDCGTRSLDFDPMVGNVLAFVAVLLVGSRA